MLKKAIITHRISYDSVGVGIDGPSKGGRDHANMTSTQKGGVGGKSNAHIC